MRVFIAGATGVIGRRLVPLLTSKGHEVIGLARSYGAGVEVETLGAKVAKADALDSGGLCRPTSDVPRSRPGQPERDESPTPPSPRTDPDPSAASPDLADQCCDGSRNDGLRHVRVLPDLQPAQRATRHQNHLQSGDLGQPHGIHRNHLRDRPAHPYRRDRRPAWILHHHRPRLGSMARLCGGRNEHPDGRRTRESHHQNS